MGQKNLVLTHDSSYMTTPILLCLLRPNEKDYLSPEPAIESEKIESEFEEEV